MTTQKKFHWFWAWQDDKEEAWLGEMAQQGWHLQKMDLPSFYTFEWGEPREMAYRLDFFTDPKDKGSYLQLFQDAGWEYLGEMGSWQYFRKPVIHGEAQEIYSDKQSKIKKYQRVAGILVVFMPIYLMMLNNVDSVSGTFGIILTVLFTCIVLFFTYALIMLAHRIIVLKKAL